MLVILCVCLSERAGDNLVLKWQLLSELLNCSMKIVAVRRSCGAVNDARLQCLEALKLAIKLQAPSQYVHVQPKVVCEMNV